MYGIQRVFLIIFYLISVIALFWLLFYILHDQMNLSGMIIVPFALAYLILVVVLYGFIHVTSYIPANLAGAFDPLKNDIANQKIESAEVLAARLAEFMTTFFSLAFFDIECSQVRIMETESIYPVDFFTVGEAPDPIQLNALSRESENTLYVGRLKTGNGNFHLYITPIVFGDKWLGYIAVISRRRLWKVFQHLLAEFENDFVDDQIVHVLAREAEKLNGK